MSTKLLKLHVYKVTLKQEIFPQTGGSKKLVLKVIWNTDSQQTSLSRAWPSFIFGRGMVHSEWE